MYYSPLACISQFSPRACFKVTLFAPRIMQTAPGALRRPRNAVRDRNLDANEATLLNGPTMSLARNAGGPVRREPPPLPARGELPLRPSLLRDDRHGSLSGAYILKVAV